MQVKEEITISAIKANIYSIAFVVPILLLLGLPYYALWSNEVQSGIREITGEEGSLDFWLVVYQASRLSISSLAFILIGIVIHELVHGITWAIFCKSGWMSIKFGIIWKALTPYAHCKEPLRVGAYRLGTVMPAIVVGLIPALFGIFTGNVAVFLYGLFFTWSAGGDFIMLWLTRNLKKEQWVQDHPDTIGCYVLE
jgi:hypothetical protein